MKEFKLSEVAAHKTPENGLYIVIDEGVYDVTGILFPFLPPPPSDIST